MGTRTHEYTGNGSSIAPLGRFGGGTLVVVVAVAFLALLDRGAGDALAAVAWSLLESRDTLRKRATSGLDRAIGASLDMRRAHARWSPSAVSFR
jgi:hypothetical protein